MAGDDRSAGWWAERALEAYGLGGAKVRITRLNGGVDNETLLVSRGSGESGLERFVLRRYLVTARAEVAFEVEMLDRLALQGFPAPRVVRALDGSGVSELAEGAVVLLGYVEGSAMPAEGPGSVDEPRSLARVTELVARLNVATLGIRASGSGERSRSDVGRLRTFLQAYDLDERLRGKPEALAFAEACRALLTQASRTLPALPRSLVHHDPNPGNVLVDPAGEVVGLIDFDEAYVGPCIIDVAALFHYWARTPDHWFDLEAAGRIVASYQRVRALSPEERAALPFAVRLLHAADAAEFVVRNHRQQPADFDLRDCHSLAVYHRLTAEEPGWPIDP